MHDPEFDAYIPPEASAKVAKGRSDGTTEPVDGNPWLTIWTRPRGTLRAILDTDPSRSVYLLSMGYGVDAMLGRSIQGNRLIPTALVALVLGSILGVIVIRLFGTLTRWTGSWLGGRATAAECRAALAWGSVPCAVNIPMTLVLIGAIGQNPFQRADLATMTGAAPSILLLAALARIVLLVWQSVLTIKAVAEAHRFSSWASLGAGLLACSIFIVVAVGASVAYHALQV